MEEEKKQPASHRSVRQVSDQNARGQAAAGSSAGNAQSIIKNNRAPVFLGINCEADKDYQRKLLQLMTTALK